MTRTTSIADSPAAGPGPVLADPAPELLLELLIVGPCEPEGSKLYFELGLSHWLRSRGAGLGRSLSYLHQVRNVLIALGNLDQQIEPVPLVGRSERADLLNVGLYLAGLLRRVAAAARCDLEVISDRALELLDPVDPAGRERPASYPR